jgi:hypothetical protein
MAASENRLCEWCGTAKDSVDGDGVCRDCRPKFDECQREREVMLNRYRRRENDPSVLPMTWTEAVARVAEKIGHPIDVAPDGACESATWWFVPYGWIGCAGHFVDKVDGFVTQLGSCHRLDLCFWAHDRGFRYPCDLVVEEVHDLAGTVAFLESVLAYPEADQTPGRAWSSEALMQALSTPPRLFRHQKFWFELPKFRAHALPSLFSYRLERDSGSDPKAGAKRVLLAIEAFRAIAEQADYVELLQRAHDRGVVDVVATHEHHHHCCHDEMESPRDHRKKRTPEDRLLLKAARLVVRRRETVPCRITQPAKPPRNEVTWPSVDEAWLIALNTVAPHLIVGDPVVSVPPGSELIGVEAFRLLLMSLLGHQ